jgi:dienelactone hydrolase
LLVVAVVALLATRPGRGPTRSSGTTRPSSVASRPTSSTATTAPPPTTTPRPMGPFAVGSTSTTFVEPAGGALPVRSLPTLLLYPTTGAPGGQPTPGAAPDRADGPYPLVVFSQGYDETPASYGALLASWAAAGYVVAAPTYPFTDPPVCPTCEADIVNHPRDLRFVIASVLGASASGSGTLAGLVDAAEVAVAGQSDGGDVSLAVAAAPSQRDPAVKAAIIMSGQELSSLGSGFYTAGSVPLLVTQGTADPVNVPSCSVELYDAAPAPKYYLSFLGAGHLPPYQDPGTDLSTLETVSTDFLDATLKGDQGAATTLLAAGNVPGATTVTDAPSVGPPTAPFCQDTPAG